MADGHGDGHVAPDDAGLRLASALRLLGLDAAGATQGDVRLAYRKKALVLHPDKTEGQGVAARAAATAAFKEVSAAYHEALELMSERGGGEQTQTHHAFTEPSPGAFLDKDNPFVPPLEEILAAFDLSAERSMPRDYSARRADIAGKMGTAGTDRLHGAPGHGTTERIQLRTAAPAPTARRNAGKDAMEAQHADTKSLLWGIYGADKAPAQLDDEPPEVLAEERNDDEDTAVTAAAADIYNELTQYDAMVQRLANDPRGLVHAAAPPSSTARATAPRSFRKSGIGAPNPSVPFDTQPRQAPMPNTPADVTVPMTRKAPRMHRTVEKEAPHGVDWRGAKPAAYKLAPGTDGLSAWNALGTWEERDVTPAVRKDLAKRLAACVGDGSNRMHAEVRAEAELDGEASVVLSRGRRFVVIDFVAKLPFRCMHDGTCVAEGVLSCEDYSLDTANNHDALDWSTNWESGERHGDAAAALAKAAEEALMDAARALLDGHVS